MKRVVKRRLISITAGYTLFAMCFGGFYAHSQERIQWKVEPVYDSKGMFKEGMANCSSMTNFIDKNGTSIYTYPGNTIRYSSDFSCGWSVGSDSPGGSSNMLMDKQGDLYTVDGVVKINDFHDNMAAVMDKNMKYGYINTNLEWIIEPTYDYAGDFNEGYAHVRLGDKHMYINTQGDISIFGDFVEAGDFSNGLAPAKNDNYLWGYIDYNGNYIIEPKYTSAGNFKDGIAPVTLEYRFGIIDSSGEFTALSEDIDLQRDYSGGVSVIHNRNGYGLVDKEGDVLIKCEYEEMSDCTEGVITAKKNGQWFIFNNKGEIISDMEVSELGTASENLIAAALKANDAIKWGFISNPLATPSDWAVSSINEMFDNGCMTDAVSYEYQTYITRSEFCDLAIKAAERQLRMIFPISDRIVFGDTDNINVAKLHNSGIIEGVTESDFEPEMNITREQIAKIVMQLGRNYFNISSNMGDFLYNDNSNISEWAKEAVYCLNTNSIMYGSDNVFRPKDYVTKEEAVIIISRLIKKL